MEGREKGTAMNDEKRLQRAEFLTWKVGNPIRDIAFDRTNIAIFVYPSCVYPPPLPAREGFPWDDLCKT